LGAKCSPSDLPIAAIERGPFERFAERATRLVSGAAFFAGCALLVLVWLGSYFRFGDPDTWHSSTSADTHT
jgi:low affinity Fe/Cu permease